MTSVVDIDIKVRDNELSKLDVASEKLEKLGKTANDTGGPNGFGGFVRGMADAKAGFDVFSEALHKAVGMVEDVNALGVASLRAKDAFAAMGGSADAIERMQAATHYLADDTDLLQAGTLALSAGVVKSTADLEELARIGATLGVTFKGSAKEGINAFTIALDSVGNVRALRQLGIDTLAVKDRFEELKKTMSDQEAWKMAVFEVAGANANKLAGALDGTGTAVEKLRVRWEDFAETQAERVATGLEAVVGWWEQLAKNPSLVLKLTVEEIVKEAGSSAVGYVSDTHNFLQDQAAQLRAQQWYNDYYAPTHPQTAPLTRSDENPGGTGWRSVWQKRGGGGGSDDAGYEGGGWRSVAQMRSGDDPYANTTADIRSLKGMIASQNINKAIDPWAEGLKSLLGITDAFKGVNSLASEYDLKLRQALAPLQAQQEILERRKAIQSIDDAFGVGPKDGLYAEVGSGMEDAIAQRRAQMEADLEKTGRRYGKRSKKYKAAEADLEEFDAGAKEAVDDYAVATGAATRESIKFRDQLDAAKKAFAEGKTSLEQYKNELLLLGEAAKQGITSMDQLTQLQRRLNLDLRPGAKSDADKSVFDQYAGGVKTKGSASGAAGEKETKPFDAVVTSANEAASAAAKVGTQGAAAVGMLAVAGVLAAGSLGQVRSQGADALEQVIRLQQELKTLASISINVTTTPRGGSDNTKVPARGPR